MPRLDVALDPGPLRARRPAGRAGCSRRTGRPARSRRPPSRPASTASSYTSRCTSIRVQAVQVWPALRNALPTPTLTALARSASARITLADLPPSSRVTRAIRSAASWLIAAPVAVEPVNETRSTSGWAARAAPATGSGAGDQVDHAGRQAGLVDGVEEQVGGQRGELGRFEDHRAAGGERGGDLGDDLVQRVVPRRDRADDAGGLADDQRVADRLRLGRAAGEVGVRRAAPSAAGRPAPAGPP